LRGKLVVARGFFFVNAATNSACDFSEPDYSSEGSDGSDGYNSFHQNKKSVKHLKSHAELVAALTKKKPRATTSLPRKKSAIPKVELTANQLNRSVGEFATNKVVTKPPKRPTSFSVVKLHKSSTIDLNQEFDELLAELDYMEKTNKMYPTIQQLYGPKGTFDKSSGRIQNANVIVNKPLVVKKTLTESVKHINKKLEEKDSDFMATEDENEESSDTISEENEEEQESSEDALLVTKRKAVSKKDLLHKTKYEYDSDYSVSKADLKMMKSLKKSTARLENPDYESEEESEESEMDDEKDEDWSNAELSEEDVPL
jgi:hypothetical protein